MHLEWQTKLVMRPYWVQIVQHSLSPSTQFSEMPYNFQNVFCKCIQVYIFLKYKL